MPLEHHLSQLATTRLSLAFSQSIKNTFLAFVAFMSWDIHQVTTLRLLCFLEYLQFNGVKQPQMANYLSAIKTKFLIFALDVACFSDYRLRYYQKAVQMHSPLNVKLKSIIDISLLKRIVHQCDYVHGPNL